MTDTWQITDGVAAVVKKGLAQYVRNPGAPDFDYCAAIMWTLGGDAYLADGRHMSLPPRYDLGIINRDDIAPQGFVVIDDPRLGLLAFAPRKEDLESDRRLIDYNGEDIVVR